ncbi:MAG TPA: hypothetical protein VGT60_06740 [Candidatus Limnocylindria bacterium]|nr:hypothetical protein [Candidatus Limnocylindria bacterium]
MIQDAAPWLGLTALIGLLDHVTPPAYAFASIYFIPIFPTAWRSPGLGHRGVGLELRDAHRRVRPRRDPRLDPPA